MNINYNNHNGGFNNPPDQCNNYNNAGTGYNNIPTDKYGNYNNQGCNYSNAQQGQFNSPNYSVPGKDYYQQPVSSLQNTQSFAPGYYGGSAANNFYTCNSHPQALNEATIKKQQRVFQRKQLRKAANIIGAGMMIFIVGTAILSYILTIPVVYSNMYNYNSAYAVPSIDPLMLYIMNAILSLICEFAAAAFIIKMCKYRFDDTIKIKRTGIADTVKYVFAGMGFVFIFNLLLSLMNANLSVFGFENKTPDYGEVTGLAGNIIYFISIAIVPPIIEEFLFRGAILGSLRKYGDGIAIIVSAVMFGFAHANFMQTPVTFLTGLVLGYLTIKTNSIIPAMILHFVNNATAVLSEKLMLLTTDDVILDIIDISIALAFLVVGLICAAMLIKKYGNKIFELDSKPQENKAGLTMSKRLVYVFTSPCMIIFTIVTILSCIVALVQA